MDELGGNSRQIYTDGRQRSATRGRALSPPRFGHMDVEMTFDDPKMYTRPAGR